MSHNLMVACLRLFVPHLIFRTSPGRLGLRSLRGTCSAICTRRICCTRRLFRCAVFARDGAVCCIVCSYIVVEIADSELAQRVVSSQVSGTSGRQLNSLTPSVIYRTISCIVWSCDIQECVVTCMYDTQKLYPACRHPAPQCKLLPQILFLQEHLREATSNWKMLQHS